MNLQEHLKILARQAKSKNSNLINADEVAGWPNGRLDKLIEIGVLIPFARKATSIKCPGCSEQCPVKPTIETGTDGGVYIEVVCRQEGKTIEINSDSLKQWEIVKDKLIELGYYKEPEAYSGKNENSGEPRSNIRGMTWQQAQVDAIKYVDQKGFSGIDKLFKEVGCSKNTMYKAIKNSRVLKDAKSKYDTRRKSAIKTLKAVGLSKKTLVKQEQTTEMSPEIQAELNTTDIDTMTDYLVNQAPLDKQKQMKKELNKRSGQEISDIYRVFLETKEIHTQHKQA